MKTNKILIILLLLVIVISITSVVLVVEVYGKNGNEEKVPENFDLTLDTMYCDIKDSRHIVRISVTIETNNKETLDLLTNKTYVIKNNINEIVRNKTEDELKGKDGQVGLQREIKDNLIQVFNKDSIINVYFNEFVIQ